MVKVTGVNVAEGKLEFASKGKEKQKIETRKVGIATEQFDKLIALAHKDGYVADGETDKGILAQDTRMAARYVSLAVEALLVKRAGDLDE